MRLFERLWARLIRITKLKNPALFETLCRVTLVASSVSVTVAFGTTAPVESLTVPVMLPVAFWPYAERPHSNAAISRNAK